MCHLEQQLLELVVEDREALTLSCMSYIRQATMWVLPQEATRVEELPAAFTTSQDYLHKF